MSNDDQHKLINPAYVQRIREGLVPDKIRFDCRHYTGYKPCGKNDVCEGCEQYAPQGRRIAIIKLGALGDVLRTTPLLRALHARHQPCHVTWVTNPAARALFTGNQFVDRVLTFEPRHLLVLQSESFDDLFCLDKDAEAIALAMQMTANRKMGFSMSAAGTPSIFNDEALYALQLALSDPLKFFYNQKTYQEIIFEAAGFKYSGEEYVLTPTPAALVYAEAAAARAGFDPAARRVGINTGCGSVFLTKQWTVDGFCDLIGRIAAGQPEAQCVLLGGEREREFNAEIMRRMEPLTWPDKGRDYARLVDSGCDNTLEQFIGIVDLCGVVVSSDSLAMHIAIGLGKKVAAFFGPTCAQEIDLYGRGVKIITDFSCSPCYLKTCDKNPTCMQAMTGAEVYDALRALLTDEPAPR